MFRNGGSYKQADANRWNSVAVAYLAVIFWQWVRRVEMGRITIDV